MGYPITLARTKNWGTEILTDTDLEAQLDLIINWINSAMEKTSGHKHDGTTSEGPKLATLSSPVTGDITFAGNITFSNAITIPETPTNDTDAASKGYVDDANKIIQVVNTQSSALVNVTSNQQIPLDDTTPLYSEGYNYSALDTAITASDSSNILLVEVNVMMGTGSGGGQMTVALFQDGSGSDSAVCTATQYVSSAGNPVMVPIKFYTTAGTTSATTFSINCGNSNVSNFLINGASGSRLYGGTGYSSITITEIAA